MRSWVNRPRLWLERHFAGPLITPESKRATYLALAATSVLLVIALIGAGLTLHLPRALLVGCAVACVGLLIAIPLALPAWRPEVAREAYGWQGFRHTLASYSRMNDAPDDFFILWDRHYCYAAAMGVAEKFLRNLRRAMPMRDIEEAALASSAAWLGARSLSSKTFSTISQSVTTLSRSLGSAAASSGASIGGGGGGGGGGR